MVEKRRGLGRGLGALISGSPSGNEDNSHEVDNSSSVSNEVSTTATASAMESRHQKSSSAKETPVSIQDSAAQTPGAAKAVPVSRETSSNNGQTPSSKPEMTASSDSSSAVNVVSSTKAAAPSPMSRAAEQSSITENKAPSSKGTSPQRQGRPVDMFFTPGRKENAARDDPSPETVSERRNIATRSRRVAVPDVLGKVRNPRDEMNDSPDHYSAQSTDLSSEQTPVTEKETDSFPYAESKPVADTSDVSRETLVAVPGATFAELNVVSIHPNRKQPRTVFDDEDMAELVHSIREVGLLQPIVVRPSDEGGDQTYELVMGERRWRAVQQAGLATIPAIVRETSDTALLRDALLENLHRSQLNPLEEAAAYQQLMQEFDCTQDELSARIGRSRPQISNTIRLMRLPALVQRRVAAGVLSAGHARALLGLEDVADMERLAQRIVNEGLSVRATEEIVSMNDGLRRKTREKAPRSTARHERLDYLASSLSDHLETNVKISLGAKKGRVSIEFGSVEDLNRIMGVIAPSAEQ